VQLTTSRSAITVALYKKGEAIIRIASPFLFEEKNMRLIAASAFAAPLLLASAALVAQNAPAIPGTPDPARVTGGTYAVDGNHTQVLFSFNHLGFTHNVGVIAAPAGSLTLDPKNAGTASVTVTFPIANIQSGVPTFNEHLASAQWFDAAQFPTATFKSTGVAVNGTKAIIKGDLTIKGITKPVTLDATFVGAGTNPMSKKETIGFDATGTIKRSDFGLGAYAPLIGDQIELKIAAAFEK
jgi:polyisoprenoid-binding protein YceI